MILSAHQPAYLPWLGYFEKIARADVFVYLDHVQYEKNSFINRNQIKGPNGPMWLTIPVKTKGHTSSSLRSTEIDDSKPWRLKHIKALSSNYKKARFFQNNFVKIQELLQIQESMLSELCWRQLQFWLSEYDIKTLVVRGSNLPVRSKKSNLVLDLCKQLGANTYYSGSMGRNYLDEVAFAAAGVKIIYQDFKPFVYPQLWGEFKPHMSIVDYWMNCDKISPRSWGD